MGFFYFVENNDFLKVSFEDEGNLNKEKSL